MQDDPRLRALMAAYQAGDLDAFEQLYAVLSPALGRWMRTCARDGAEADDLVQETFLQIHRARHTYDAAYPVAPWAYAIAQHVWLMHRRARSRRPQPHENVDDLNLGVRAEVDRYAERAEVRDALAALPASRRRPVIWHHVLGFSFREIAVRLGIRETAAKLRSSRGMAELRTRFGSKRGHTNDE
jgi:RNA polymerase sigma-70 factor (ECF subfamily)